MGFDLYLSVVYCEKFKEIFFLKKIPGDDQVRILAAGLHLYSFPVKVTSLFQPVSTNALNPAL